MKTHEQFYSEILPTLQNNGIRMLGKYIKAREKIIVECLKCGNIWRILPMNLKCGQGCPVCSHKKLHESRRMSQEEFLERTREKHPTIEFLSEYISQRQKISCRCKICGTSFELLAGSILQSKPDSLCPKCRDTSREKTRLSQADFVKKVKQVNSLIEVTGKFTATREKIQVECKLCGTKWYAISANIIAGKTSCPKCKYSTGERAISQFLEQNGIEFESQKKIKRCKDSRELPFDFYLPKYNICIEYDGEFHYKTSGFHGGESKLNYTKKHDDIKTNFCRENNITLVRIPYFERKNFKKILNTALSLEGGGAE